MERKLASIRRISDIQSIPGADAIEVAQVDGWKVVVKKGEFQVDDMALYLEIDSFVPNSLAGFLSKGKEPREFNGIKGERLKTIKLRGQTSQGLLLKIENYFNVVEINGKKYINTSESYKATETEDVYIQDNKQNKW